jgi:hypothetical protein
MTSAEVTAKETHDGRVAIEFDAKDLVACWRALDEVYRIIEDGYGVVIAQDALARNHLGKSKLAKTKNF